MSDETTGHVLKWLAEQLPDGPPPPKVEMYGQQLPDGTRTLDNVPEDLPKMREWYANREHFESQLFDEPRWEDEWTPPSRGAVAIALLIAVGLVAAFVVTVILIARWLS